MLPKRDGMMSKHALHRSAFHAQSAGLPQMVHFVSTFSFLSSRGCAGLV